jgi:hypothetical protein
LSGHPSTVGNATSASTNWTRPAFVSNVPRAGGHPWVAPTPSRTTVRTNRTGRTYTRVGFDRNGQEIWRRS